MCRIIKLAHNRGCRELNKLDLWSNENLEDKNRKKTFKLDSGKGEISLGDDYVKCLTKHSLLLAAWNYVEIMRELFPLDVGPRAIYRVLLTMLLKASTTEELMRKFFAEAVEENSGIACRDVAPLSHDKLLSR